MNTAQFLKMRPKSLPNGLQLLRTTTLQGFNNYFIKFAKKLVCIIKKSLLIFCANFRGFPDFRRGTGGKKGWEKRTGIIIIYVAIFNHQIEGWNDIWLEKCIGKAFSMNISPSILILTWRFIWYLKISED